MLTDGLESRTTTMDTPTSGNLLDNTQLPAGTTASVTSFTLAGSSTVYTPGPTPVTLTDPVTGEPIGTLAVSPNGTYVFTPAPGYVGDVPLVSYTVRSSNGQTVSSALTLSVTGVEPLTDASETVSTPPGEPVSGDLLANADLPPGTTAEVTSFRVPGVDTPLTPGPTPVPLTDPTTGTVTGTIVVNPDGTYVFTPAPGYSGPVPPITYTVTSSDGQANESQLGITVNEPLADNNEQLTTTGTAPVSTNLLTNTDLPPGTTATVTGFTLPGSTTVLTPGPTPVTVRDPTTGTVTGTIVVQPDGNVTFTPAAGFTGTVPPISYTVTSSDGQTDTSALSVVVKSGEPTHACMHAISCTRGSA